MRLLLPLLLLLGPLSLRADVAVKGGAAEAEPQAQPGGAQAEVSKLKPLRLMTYNIHHGEGVDGKFDLQRIAKIISDGRADLVALQEVDVKTRRSNGVDQAAELARATGMHYAFGKFMDYQGGEYGQAVLSKFPIINARNLALPPGPEPRAALAVEVDVPAWGGVERLVFVGNHFYATEEERSAQATRLTLLLHKELKAGVPVILAGDFNSTPGSKPMTILGQHWFDPTARKNEKTWPSDRPRVEIDYILYSPQQRFKCLKSKVLVEKQASDHRPVITILQLLKPEPDAG